jgi:hypothetical protein
VTLGWEILVAGRVSDKIGAFLSTTLSLLVLSSHEALSMW